MTRVGSSMPPTLGENVIAIAIGLAEVGFSGYLRYCVRRYACGFPAVTARGT
jgi:hypothetical protein